MREVKAFYSSPVHLSGSPHLSPLTKPLPLLPLAEPKMSTEGRVALAVSPCTRGHQLGDIPTWSLVF